MNSINAVITALVLGALDRIYPRTATQTIQNLYGSMKLIIQNRYPDADLKLLVIEKYPRTLSMQSLIIAGLQHDLQSAGMGADTELIAQAQNLLAEVEQDAMQEFGFYIKREDVQAANKRLKNVIAGIEQTDVEATTVKIASSIVNRSGGPLLRGAAGTSSTSRQKLGLRRGGGSLLRGAANVSQRGGFLGNLRDALGNTPVVISGGDINCCSDSFVESNYLYPVWFGTTRKPNDKNELSNGFKNERDNGEVYYGKCNVLIPENHRFGEIGRSWFHRWMQLDFENDYLKLCEIIPFDSANGFWLDLKNQFAENKGDALVYLHGYNTSFEEAAIRAAQIGFDLKVSGATAFFSWPSKSEISGYPDDVASIEASEIAITDFLLDFTRKSGATKVHLIAHSMGNRGLIRALSNIQHKLEKDSSVPFGQIILAAPDLDVQLFRNLAYLYPMLAERTTLYASRKDKAVAASEWVHGFQRVGIAPPITVVDKIDTIEVEEKSFSLFFELGHSYFAEAESILHDIYDLLRHNSKPSERQRLKEEKTEAGDVYWLMSS